MPLATPQAEVVDSLSQARQAGTALKQQAAIAAQRTAALRASDPAAAALRAPGEIKLKGYAGSETLPTSIQEKEAHWHERCMPPPPVRCDEMLSQQKDLSDFECLMLP